MNIHLINTGRELMLGQRLNTHHQWLAQHLLPLGFPISKQVTVDDSADAITGALQASLASAHLILVTGGLGPTQDDRTRDCAAQLLGLQSHHDPAVADHIRSFFVSRKRPCPERVLVQAQVPDGATVLPNPHGTAPGLILEFMPSQPSNAVYHLVLLPGPPRELYPMVLNHLIPRLQSWFPDRLPQASLTLRTTGLGESWVEEKLERLLDPLESQGLEVGYCAHPGQVDVHLLARGPQTTQLLDQANHLIRQALGRIVFSDNPAEDLEHVVVRELTTLNKTLAVAESCTGGLLAHRITNVPGASDVLRFGWVTYANAAKELCLGVQPETLRAFGAVSEPTAREMADGARRRAQADYALAITGIAGPSGGSPDKPVGTVCIGLATPDQVQAKSFLNPYDRETFKRVTTQQALAWLLQSLPRPDRDDSITTTIAMR